MKLYYVYILASKRNGTLYIGMTNDLKKRVYEHKNNTIKSFTQKYNIHNLVHYETFNNVWEAITREKQLKKWNRQWKINLIEKHNPDWKDLCYEKSERIGVFLIFERMDSRLRGNDRVV